MGLSHFPQIVTNGLILYYDMNNTGKSWRGRPTTNTAANGKVDYYSRWAVTTNHPPLPFGKITDVYILTLGNNYFGSSSDYGITNGNTYTVSYWYYIDTTQTMNHYAMPLTSSYSAAATASVSTFVDTNNTRNVSGNINGWVWGYKTFTVNAAPTYMRGTFTNNGDNDPTGVMYITNVVIEAGSTPSGPYGYTGGTRSSTQAILDLMNNNTITASSLTYNSDGTFSFVRANSNYLNISGNANTRFQNSYQTWSAWVNISSTGPNGYSELWNNGGNQGMTIQWRAGAIGFFIYNGAYLDYPVSVTNALNTWMNITCVIDNVARVMILYKNGVLVGTSPQWSSYTPPNGNVHIGGNFATGNGGDFTQGSIPTVQLYNRALSAAEIQQNYNATKAKYVGSSQDNPALSAAAIRAANPSVSDGVYWILPKGQTTPYQCYCQFNYLGNDWFAVSGMSSSGVRADANGNSSGLAGLLLAGENTGSAALTGTSAGNNNGLNFTLPRDWINACKPRALRVKSSTQDMSALFNKTGNYVSAEDIWSYYYAMNNYDNVPVANGRRHTAATVNSWLNTNVKIYQGTSVVGDGALWSGNNHCGWSDGNHMLHGSTNYSYPGPYPGFCLDGTCWNEAGIVWIAGT